MLVSVIVRSMGRPHLRAALESLARQNYPSLEVIVVDATGGIHPPLPDLAWGHGHHVRMIGGEQKLLRPHAANTGLQAVTGEWFCFLDDDDSYDADFVSLMVAQIALHPEQLAIYGSAKVIGEDGDVLRTFGVDFNRALFYHRPLFYWQAALFSRRVIELGCRFDPDLPVCEDRDFLAQIAEHTDFAYVPVFAMNYGLTTGTSGTTVGANFNPALHIPSEKRLRAKWAGDNAYHVRRATRTARLAAIQFSEGHIDAARALLERLLVDYPDDPNALSGLARIALDCGRDTALAVQSARRAVYVNPTVAEYRLTLAEACQSAGLFDEAREHARLLVDDVNQGAAARAVLASLPQSHADGAAALSLESQGAPLSIAPGDPAPSRLSPCTCGSGLRYKDCCGRLGAAWAKAAAPNLPQHPVAPQLAQACARFEAGFAAEALEQLQAVAATDLNNAAEAAAAGRICLELNETVRAQQFIVQALQFEVTNADAAGLLARCAEMQCAALFSASAYRMVDRVRQRMRAAAIPDAQQHSEIHVLATLGSLGGSERHALNVARVLSRHLPVVLWSTSPLHPALAAAFEVRLIDVRARLFPRRGTLVVVGQYFTFDDWLPETQFSRIIIRHNIDLPQELVERVTDVEMSCKGATLEFNFPSKLFQNRVGLEGWVEYSMPDTDVFVPVPHRGLSVGHPLVVGRHSRDQEQKHHPNDLALYRRIVAAGHSVRLQGASGIARKMRLPAATQSHALDSRIHIQPFGHEEAVTFLASLDCFIYRIHPNWYETGGNVIHEAMAMERAVIVIGDRIGAAELIEHGVNGFHVFSENEALDVLNLLATNVELRQQIGRNARRTILTTIAQQEVLLRDHYRHTVISNTRQHAIH